MSDAQSGHGTHASTPLAPRDWSADELELAFRTYRLALSPEDQEKHPYYRELCKALASSPTALSLLLSIRPEQRNPMLVLASLHYAALTNHEVLGPLYASLASPGSLSPENFANAVVAVVEATPDVVKSQLHRSTQTNEIGRSAIVMAVLSELAKRGVSSINLIDVGMSAGLNLYPDHYVVSSDGSENDAVLACESLGQPVSWGPLPRIGNRVGIDPSPLSPSQPDDALWLRACLWPEDQRRSRRLAAVLDAAPQWEGIQSIRGDALHTIDDALASVDSSAPTLVFHTWVAAYFTADQQREWRKKMVRVTREANVYWLYVEWPRAIAGLEPPPSTTDCPRPGGCAIVLTAPGGEPSSWGWCHAHGRWLLFEPPPVSDRE